MEGITYGMKDSLEIIRGMGIEIRQIRLSGGGAKSPFWRQMQADIFEHPVCLINATEGPAYGVALLAGVGAGAWSSVQEACDAAIRVTEERTNNEAASRIYGVFYPVFQQVYRSLEGDFDLITQKVDEVYA